MNRYQVISFAAGLLSGAAVGGLIGTLLAPQSGNDARQAIVDKVNEIVQAGKQARFERRKQLETQYKEAIQIPLPADQKADKAVPQMDTA
jgi:gas vesicle protein